MSGKSTAHFQTLLDAADELEVAARTLEKQAYNSKGRPVDINGKPVPK